jgi:spore germination protein YaaH
MYGYEWTVDEKKRPIAPAKSLSLNEIRKKYLDSCEWQDCIIKRDELSEETEINFVQSEIQNDFAYLYYHIVWFEDETSVKKKIDYLKTKGINSFAYWAYTYY